MTEDQVLKIKDILWKVAMDDMTLADAEDALDVIAGEVVENG